MRVLILGDIVGRSGRTAVMQQLPELQKKLSVDFTIANGENAAGGFGITKEIFDNLLAAGVDVITSGNHAFDQKEILSWADHNPQFLRPANYPQGTAGKGANIYTTKNDLQILVVNLMGNIFMPPGLENPFITIERELSACSLKQNADIIIVDFHAETTSEKQCMGHFLDGKVSIVYGTHTHVPTADHMILPKGTAFQSDIGMCGDYNSSIGMDLAEPIHRFTTKISRARFEPASGEASISGILVVVDETTGLATSIAPLRVGGRLSPTLPTI